jgi:hypothetical protein
LKLARVGASLTKQRLLTIEMTARLGQLALRRRGRPMPAAIGSTRSGFELRQNLSGLHPIFQLAAVFD